MYNHKFDMKKYCDACLLYNNLWIFSFEFYDVLQTDLVSKIHYLFTLFSNIINYWCGVNKKVVDDYFEFLSAFERRCYT